MSAMKIVAPVALLTLLSVAAQPVLAQQQRGRDDRRRGESSQRATPRDSGRQTSDQRRSDVRRESAPPSRSNEARGSSYNSNRDSRQGDTRAYARRGDDGRSYNNNYSNNRYNNYNNYNNRDAYNYRNNYRGGSRTVVIAPRGYSTGWGRSVARPYPSYGPSYRSWYRSDYYYSRPYYSFRPRFSIGFGVWLGYPVALPSYGYAPYPVYGYPSGGYVNVTPTRAQSGAVSSRSRRRMPTSTWTAPRSVASWTSIRTTRR